MSQLPIVNMLLLINQSEGRFIRRSQSNVQLYSMETGRHLVISNKRISSTKRTNSPLAEIQFISVSSSEFVIKGTQTGLYVSESNKRRLKTVSDPKKATRFSEELIRENHFNKYTLGSDKDCHLTIRRNGTPKISCRAKDNAAFLPRRVHQRVHRGYNH